MGLGRRKVRLEDAEAWVFNRMADVYDARPAYPCALLDSLAELARPGRRVIELGAGIGHVALPLAERGLEVTAVEPALQMLRRLEHRAEERGLAVRALHATAEAVPLASAAFDLVVVADALHFVDAERTGLEIGRLLAPDGALALVTAELADTAYMQNVERIVSASAPRRPRSVEQTLRQVAALSRVELGDTKVYFDHTPVEPDQLQRILRSISFVGPAMNSARFAAFWSAIEAIGEPAVWSRKLTLYRGRRRGVSAPCSS